MLHKKIIQYFDQYSTAIPNYIPASIVNIKQEAIKSFNTLGFPNIKVEKWRNTDLQPTLENDYEYFPLQDKNVLSNETSFQCDVHNLDTYIITHINGFVAQEQAPLTTLQSGIKIGSIANAIKQFPELIESHFSKYVSIYDNPLVALNTAFANDGIFIYVPNNTIETKPIQIVNIVNSNQNLFLQPRYLILIGKNSRVTLVHCDHTLKHKKSFINSVAEIFIDDNASVDYYKLQNKDNNSSMISGVFIYQSNNSRLTTNTIALNGGLIRNELSIIINGSGCETNLYGLYLADREQQIDNIINVKHAAPNSSSTELYKGIIDEHARVVFNGHILVNKNAQKTNAFQTNHNILLTDTAKVFSKPHLEIYADDVKCSHGATVGQLDAEALFYMRSRGISQYCAKMLLMESFADEVINKITIEALRLQITHLVSKRLRGELSLCDQCMVGCKDINFTI